jgi:branched-chain amino acid transport system permease protein
MPKLIEKGSPAHRLWQVLGYGGVAVLIIWIATSQPDFRVQRFSLVAALTVAVLGLNLVTGYSGQISLGHSAFFGFGAYMSAILVADYGWPFYATLPVVLLSGALIGFIVGLPALRIRGLYLALVTLALAIAFPSIAKISQLSDLTGGANGKTVDSFRAWEAPGWLPFDVNSDGWRFLVLCITGAVLFLLASNVTRSRVGRALLAVRDNETGAAVSGVYPAGWKTSAFAVSAGFAAVGGSLQVLAIPVVGPETGGFVVAIELITGLVIGGLATISGAVIGGLAIVWLPELTKNWGGYLPLFDEADAPLLANAAYGILLIAVVFVMPGGIVWFIRFVRSKFVRFVPRLPAASSVPEDAPAPAAMAGTVPQAQGGETA